MKRTIIARLTGNISISADKLNYIIDSGQRDCWYYPTLEGLCEGLFEIRLKNSVLRLKITKDAINSLIKSVEVARKAISEDVAELKEVLLERTGADWTKESPLSEELHIN